MHLSVDLVSETKKQKGRKFRVDSKVSYPLACFHTLEIPQDFSRSSKCRTYMLERSWLVKNGIQVSDCMNSGIQLMPLIIKVTLASLFIIFR